MIKKEIQVEFANANFKPDPEYYIEDFTAAVNSANPNLIKKHGVRLGIPRAVENEKVIVEISIPDDLKDEFTVGNHLRGLSAFLVKYCNGRYSDAIVGKRLLKYTVLAQEKSGENSYGMVQRLDLIGRFSELLKASDEVSLEKIKKISHILGD